jgi:hypothetical protein
LVFGRPLEDVGLIDGLSAGDGIPLRKGLFVGGCDKLIVRPGDKRLSVFTHGKLVEFHGDFDIMISGLTLRLGGAESRQDCD